LLDNCEHVLDPAAHLAERLLARCPAVKVVATSRERLRVPGERVCVVPPLAVDEEHAPAKQLFVERAKAVVPDFEPDATERACIAEIVRRLDGLPLAIELAAARLHTHDVGEVAAGLDHRFALLSSGYRGSARHASLGAAVSWSFASLDRDLQQVFTDLAVFSGTFTAADAAAICGIDVVTAIPVLAELVERSLVMRAADHRFVLLETLRAFGAEQLIAAGRAELVADRHARHEVAWIEDAHRGLLDPHRPVLTEIDGALPELRAALAWLLDHAEIELAGRLLTGLYDYGFFRLRPDVMAWAERVAAADPEDASPVAPLVWVIAAYAAWMAGDVAETGVRSARALQLAERAGGDLPALVAEIRGSYALFEGRLEEAAAWYRRAYVAAEGDPALRLMAAGSELLALGYLGDPRTAEVSAALLDEVGEVPTPYGAYLWYCAGEAVLASDVERARARLGRAVELAELTNASCVVGLAGGSKASIDARLGDPTVAAADYRRLIDHWRRAGMWSTQWTMLRSIAVLLARLGRHRDAAVLEGAVRATQAGHRIFGADEVALVELSARLRTSLGDVAYEAARGEGAVLDGEAAVEHALRAL
jgi:predicted ATPase